MIFMTPRLPQNTVTGGDPIPCVDGGQKNVQVRFDDADLDDDNIESDVTIDYEASSVVPAKPGGGGCFGVYIRRIGFHRVGGKRHKGIGGASVKYVWGTTFPSPSPPLTPPPPPPSTRYAGVLHHEAGGGPDLHPVPQG